MKRRRWRHSLPHLIHVPLFGRCILLRTLVTLAIDIPGTIFIWRSAFFQC